MVRDAKEVKFCKQTLHPLLEAMRPHIINLRYRHGNTEFGKDFTFSYVNPLNQRINVGIQAKWGDIKGSSRSLVREIVDQVKVAFKVPYKNAPQGEKLYLNELYIVCSGKYTNNAIEIIERTLEKDFNAHFLDGSNIEDLERKVLARKTREKVETMRTLNALLIELNHNLKRAKEIDDHMEEYIKKRKHFLINFRLNCLERALQLDIDDKWILDEATIQWNNLTIDNNLLDQIRVVLAAPEKWREERKRLLWKNIKSDIKGLNNFRKYVASYVESLE